MLIVVEHGDVADLLQTALHLKAAGRGDVLQIDAAEAAGEQVAGADDLVHVFAPDAQRNGVHAAELLEEHALALHDGHAGLRADVAQTEDGGAVGDHGHGIPPAGQFIALAGILLDLQAGLGHAGGIGQRQIFLGIDVHFWGDGQLAPPLVVLLQRFLRVIHRKIPPYSFKNCIDTFIIPTCGCFDKAKRESCGGTL